MAEDAEEAMKLRSPFGQIGQGALLAIVAEMTEMTECILGCQVHPLSLSSTV